MLRCLLLILGGVFLAQTAWAGDPAAGQAQTGLCRVCHGNDGFARIPIAPHIGGEPAAYLEAQLRAFRDGTRAHEMMTVVAMGLPDETIEDLAAWYASARVETTIYIETQLKAFRTGKRVHDVMTEVAAGMSDADMRAVAQWYADIDLTITVDE